MRMEEVKRKPITAELRGMKPGERVNFPIESFGSVKAVISRLRVELVRDHWDARIDKIENQYKCVVTRLH